MLHLVSSVVRQWVSESVRQNFEFLLIFFKIQYPDIWRCFCFWYQIGVSKGQSPGRVQTNLHLDKWFLKLLIVRLADDTWEHKKRDRGSYIGNWRLVLDAHWSKVSSAPMQRRSALKMYTPIEQSLKHSNRMVSAIEWVLKYSNRINVSEVLCTVTALCWILMIQVCLQLP